MEFLQINFVEWCNKIKILIVIAKVLERNMQVLKVNKYLL